MEKKKLALIIALFIACIALVFLLASLLVKWTVRIESREDENRFLNEASDYILANGQEAFLKKVGINLVYTASTETDINKLYESASKAVVNISSVADMSSSYLDYASLNSIGSGFFFTEDEPYILTCAHVVGENTRFLVTLSDSTIVQANLVGKDDDEDIAIIRLLEDVEHPYLVFADSSVLKVGDSVYALGNPLGYSATITDGIISGIGRVVRDKEGRIALGRIQTSAPIGPGSSGGPLLLKDGSVGGMFSSIYTTSGAYQGMSFAINSQVLGSIATELMTNKEIKHGWLGIKAIELTAQIVQSLELEEDKGLLISEITDKSLSKKGLKAGTIEAFLGSTPVFFGGDILIEVQGQAVDSYASLLDSLSTYRSGDSVKVTVNRGGQLVDLDLVLTDRPSNAKEMIY